MPASPTADKRWTMIEKIGVSVLSTGLLAVAAGMLTLWVQVAVMQEQVNDNAEQTQKNTTELNRGRRYTIEDAAADRALRGLHESAVLKALVDIKNQQTQQVKLLAEISTRLVAVEQEARDAREERRYIEKRLDAKGG